MTAAVVDPVIKPAAATPSAAPAAVTGQAAVAPAGVPAVVGEVKAGAPAAPAAPAAPTRLLADATPDPAKPAAAAVPATDPPKPAPAAADAKPAEWTLKAPEGAALSADDVKAAETFAKENGLSQAQAEKLLAREVAGRTAAQAARTAEAEQVGQQWLEQAKAHPEIGGAKLDAAVANAKRALNAFATAEERQAIAASPFANNPMFLAILNRAAAALPAEDVVHAGGGAGAGAAAPADPAGVLYKGFRRG